MIQTITMENKQQIKSAYSLKEAAKEMALSVPYIRNEIRDGNLRAKKAGRRVLILGADLLAYLEDKEDWKPTNTNGKTQLGDEI